MYCSASIIAPPADKRNFFLCRSDHSDHRDTLSVFVFDTAGNAIIAFGDEFFARNKPEDAHFTTYLLMTDEEIEELEENSYGGETVLVAAEETKDGKGVSVISSKQLAAEMI